MAAPGSELGWVVHFAPVVRFTPLSPTDYLMNHVIIQTEVEGSRREAEVKQSMEIRLMSFQLKKFKSVSLKMTEL